MFRRLSFPPCRALRPRRGHRVLAYIGRLLLPSGHPSRSALGSHAYEAQSLHLSVAAWSSRCLRFATALTDGPARLASPWAATPSAVGITPTLFSQLHGARDVHVRENQAPGIIHDELQPRPLLGAAPPDPLVAHPHHPGGGRPPQQGHPVRVDGRDVPQRFPHQAAKAQVVVRRHQGAPRRAFGGAHPTHLQGWGPLGYRASSNRGRVCMHAATRPDGRTKVQGDRPFPLPI